ncbi:MAG: hypothetical protein HY815_32275 [Candidatus Riflebacteria bacterium]|nr:hypothetical protein [Candidatus Riflebacteria bacterium]
MKERSILGLVRDGVRLFGLLVLVLVVVMPDEGCSVTVNGQPVGTAGATSVPFSPASTTSSLFPTAPSTSATGLTTASSAQQIQVVVANASTSMIYGHAYDPSNPTAQLAVGLFLATATSMDAQIATGVANLDDVSLASVTATGHSYLFNLTSLGVPAGTQVVVKARSVVDPTQLASSSPVTLQAVAAAPTTVTTTTN